MKLISGLCIVIIFGVANSSKQYDGYKLFRVNFKDGQADALKLIITNDSGADIWLFSTADRIADVFTSPEAETKLLKLLVDNGYSFRLLNGDVQSLIEV